MSYQWIDSARSSVGVKYILWRVEDYHYEIERECDGVKSTQSLYDTEYYGAISVFHSAVNSPKQGV